MAIRPAPRQPEHDQIIVLRFPLWVLAVHRANRNYAVTVAFARHWGDGFLVATSSQSCQEAMAVLRETMPQYREGELFWAPIASLAMFRFLREEMARQGFPTQGFYRELRWPGPKYYFTLWAHTRRASEFGHG
jgi:hypothetical protein